LIELFSKSLRVWAEPTVFISNQQEVKMDNEFYMVYDFHKKFSHPVSDEPKMLSKDRAFVRGKWMQEELLEFYFAEDIVAQSDGLIDLIYFALGTLVEMGVPPQKIFEIVHNANMSKLWEDGKPRYNKDGKTMKPPTWQDPTQELAKAIQMLQSNEEMGNERQ